MPTPAAPHPRILTRLWLFTLFTMVFRDIHELSTQSTIEGLLVGTFEGRPVTDAGLVLGGVVLLILIGTLAATDVIAPGRAARLNLAVAPLAIAGLFILPPNDPDDYLLGAAIVMALAAICGVAWHWHRALRHGA